jgi:uncharacterized protein
MAFQSQQTTGKDLKAAVVVTGASRGIGRALAEQFASINNNVLLIGRTPEPLQQAAGDIVKQYAVVAIPLALDVCEPQSLPIIDRALADHQLYCDVLINNAALGLAGPFISHQPERIDELVDLNIRALTRLTRAYLPAMLERGRGGVMNISSLGGFVPGPNQAAYYASKAYVLSLTEALASECAGRGVKICAIAPGPVKTAFHSKMGAESSLYRWIVPEASPEAIARSALRGWRMGRRVVAPGLLATVGSYGLRVVPHALTGPVIRRLLEVPDKPD